MTNSKQTISQITSININLSERANIILNKTIESLLLNELAYLIREQISVGISIPIAVNKLRKEDIQISMLYRNSCSEDQRELIRELVLLDSWYWDRNAIANRELKEILGISIDYLNLPHEIIEKFKTYEIQDLIWDKKSFQDFNSYMNDSRVGVTVGFGMVISFKRAILNGNPILFEIKENLIPINNIENFEELIVSNLNCNSELRELLNKEYRINDL
jgi:hypothetical protein